MTYHTTEELIGGRSEWAVSPNNFNGLIDSHILANQRISELEAQLAEEKQKVADLENPAAFGWQCYQDRCENAYVEQSVVKRMETALQVAREALCLSPTGDDYRLMAISLSGTALKQDMQEHIALYEEKRSKALARTEEVSRD